ncbi:MAG: hypothetical protein JRI23_32020 [Deltaproteobacteria bacterium]|jgi:hypothetical protein|nr:hypothetical protein [Deltaproteobacteria bacterium]MBW2536855.1 hypothetical protein [Deltaproteobacteria bacterium]
MATHILPRPLTVRPLLAGHLDSPEVMVDVDYDLPPLFQEPPSDAVPSGEPRMIARHRYLPPERWQELPPPDDTSDPMVEPPPEVVMAPDGETPTTSDYDAPPSTGDYTGTWGWPGGPRSWALAPGGIPNMPSEAAPTRPQPRREVDSDVAGKVVNRALRAKDRTLGLDLPAAAAIAAVVGGAVRAAETPPECVARVAVALGGDGRVQNVNLLSYSGGGTGAWQQVVRSVRAQLASRTFAMKSAFAKGAVVTITVRSRMRMPSGSGSREGLGLSFDPSNIGARPKRLVTTGVHVQAVP